MPTRRSTSAHHFRLRVGGGGGRNLDLNRGAIFNDTIGVLPSKPLHTGVPDLREERERLRSSYSVFHGPKIQLHNRRSEIFSKPSSRRLLAGTNEFAEDLTGQRLPLNAAAWKSETKANFDGKVQRPSSAPTCRRLISLMDNEEPIFGKTASSTLYDRHQRGMLLFPSDLNPHQTMAPSQFRGRDLYQSTYSLDHRQFGREERMQTEHYVKERRTRPWLQEPVTDFRLQHRDPACVADNRIYPNDAQLATLPHYVDPKVRTGRSEVQESFSNPYKAADFYFEEPNKLGSKPAPRHLLKTFIN